MSGSIFTIIIGAFAVALGVLNMMGNISTLHYYHRKRVSEEDRIPFGRLVGLGTIIIGISVILLGVSLILAQSLNMHVFEIIGSVIVISGLVIGLALSFYAMIKYNHGIF